jgi:hypothetical protein
MGRGEYLVYFINHSYILLVYQLVILYGFLRRGC